MIQRKLYFLLLLLFIFFAIFPLKSLASKEYIVDEGDVLAISVYGHNDLTTTVRVSGQGFIIFPLINQLEVAGKTIPQISGIIAKSLADGYIVDPQVNVFVKEFRAQNVFISGEVHKPGAYQFELDMTLIKVIALAEGFKDTADDKQVIITRKTHDKIKSMKQALMDEPIEPGDVIVVPEKLIDDIFVTGQVKRPGVYRYEPGITLIKAVTMAGGFTDFASQGRIKITRKNDLEEVVLERVKMNELLQDGDVVEVPEGFF